MPRETVELLRCDRCPNEGTLYTVTYGDGDKEFVLCDKHNSPLVKLREVTYGTWKPRRKRRAFKKVELPPQ